MVRTSFLIVIGSVEEARLLSAFVAFADSTINPPEKYHELATKVQATARKCVEEASEEVREKVRMLMIGFESDIITATVLRSQREN